MTNEEKAKEFKVNDVCCVWNGGCPNVYNAAMDMAEWKEQQFAEEKKQWIEKVCNFLENRNVLEKDCSILSSGICSITFHPDNLINDLKQAMGE